MNATRKLVSVRRDWRERDVRVLLAALMVAVATVATIALFASQLQKTLVSSASAFLAADRQLESENGQPIPPAWFEQARSLGLQTARMTEFSTMISGADRFQLVSVKAVGPHYPLRGEIEFQPALDQPHRMVRQGPARGEVWLSPRLLQLLSVQVGDRVDIGNLSLSVSGVLVREPDGGFSMSALAPRIMMNVDDVAATGVIRTGSRVNYVALFAGAEPALKDFYGWLKLKLGPSHEWKSVRDGQALSQSLEKAERFLLLGGSLAVLLAAVAVAVASRQYALGQRDTVALLKTLGVGSRRIGQMYIRRLLLWGLVGIAGGLLVTIPLYVLLSEVVSSALDRPLAYGIDPIALLPALLTALVSLFGFAYPPLRRLRTVPAMQVLRSQPGEAGWAAVTDAAIAALAVFGLVWLYARDITLVLSLLGGLAVLLLVLAAAGWLLVIGLRRLSGGGSAWRLALLALYRHRRASLSQIAVFAMTMMLACTLILVRTSLLDDWEAQLPADAPNQFLINIAPDAVNDVKSFLNQRGAEVDRLYPMVRGRLTELNGRPVREAVGKDRNINALNRELNLSWMSELPDDNRIQAGQWFTKGEKTGVSIEAGLAARLGVKLGDQLGFTIGSQHISEPVTSIRTVQWDSMKPNFYMAFPPGGALENMPATWITSFYLPPSRAIVLNDFSRTFPTISVLSVGHIIDRIRTIITQVTQAIETILLLILAAAITVMAAVVSATLQSRQREGALMRTLGARQSLLVGSTLMEFALLGLFAGLLGVMAAEAAVWALQLRLFEGVFRWHWAVIVPLPLISAALLAVLGRWQLDPVLRVSPMLLLRRLE